MSRRFAAVAGTIASFSLLAALIGLAVETAAHRSSLAIAAVIAATVYAVFLVLAWRRADAIAQALVGLAAFGGVLACDNALFGTLAASGGVSLLGFDADRLAALLVLALSFVTVTGVVLLRPLARGLKISAACIVTFACAPIVFALVQRTGMSAALTTNAPLPPGPVWIRGAYVAALVVLPLSAVVALALAIVSLARKRFATGQRALAAALAFALATQLTGLEAAHAGLPALALGATPAAAIAMSAQNGGPAVTASGAPAPSIAKAVARIGTDPAALLSRVSNNVAYEIYPGVFRGAAATLADGAGNDVDKALLLHDLMHAANAATALRFASCTLSSQQTDALVAAAARSYRVPVLAAQNQRVNAPHFHDPQVAEMFRNAPAVWKSISAQAHQERTALQGEIASANATLAPSPGLTSALAGIAATHVWLQAQQNGNWLDLDPTLPAAKPGTALCSAQSTFAVIPDAQYDTISAVARVERRRNGALDEQPAVQGTWRTADLGDGSLAFAFAETAGLSPASTTPDQAGMSKFTPVFLAGSTITAGTPVFVPAPPKHNAAGASGLGDALSGATSALDGSPTPTPTSAPSSIAPREEITRVAIALSVTVPGMPAQSSDAAVFDRVSFADRAAGRAAVAALAPLADSNGQYSRFSDVWNIAVHEGTGMVGVGDHASAAGKKTGPLGMIAVLGTIQRSYGTLRRAIFADVAGNGAPVIDNATPGVSILAATWMPSGASAKPAATLAMNVVSDHARPRSPDANAALSWAVSSLLAERTVVSADQMMHAVQSSADPAAIGALDVFAVFDAAQKGNIATGLVRSGTDIGAALPPDVKARLASSLDGGQLALAPARTVTLDGNEQYGWWNIRSDGSVVDEMANGRHQDMPERGGILSRMLCAAPMFASLGRRVAMVAVATMAIQGGMLGGEAMEEATAEAQYAVLEEEEAAEIEAAVESAAETGC